MAQAATTGGTADTQQATNTPNGPTWVSLSRLEVPRTMQMRIERFAKTRCIRHFAEAHRQLLEQALKAAGE